MNKESKRLLVGVILALVTFATWIAYYEYVRIREHKPTVKERAKEMWNKWKKDEEKR